jgi:hypothetical protein
MFSFTKWERREEIERELFMEGEVPVLVHSLEVWEHPRPHALDAQCETFLGLSTHNPITRLIII